MGGVKRTTPHYPNIIVMGDVNIDTLIVRIPQTSLTPSPMPEPIKRYRRFVRDGGALLLSKAVKAAVSGLWAAAEDEHALPVHSYDPSDLEPKYRPDKDDLGPDRVFLQLSPACHCREALHNPCPLPEEAVEGKRERF